MSDDATTRRPSTLRDRPAPATRPARRDPLGKQALFSTPLAAAVAGDATDQAAHDQAGEVFGNDDPLADTIPFPTPPSGTRLGTVAIECSLCGDTARIGYGEFVVANLPVGLWMPIPGKPYNRLMRCPSCEQRAWVRARWFG